MVGLELSRPEQQGVLAWELSTSGWTGWVGRGWVRAVRWPQQEERLTDQQGCACSQGTPSSWWSAACCMRRSDARGAGWSHFWTAAT